MYIENVKIVSLQDLLDELKDKKFVRDSILKNFKNKYNKDIEDFLHNKAIEFEKAGLSSTHLVFSESFILLGYFLWQINLYLFLNEIMKHYPKVKEKSFVKMVRD